VAVNGVCPFPTAHHQQVWGSYQLQEEYDRGERGGGGEGERFNS